MPDLHVNRLLPYIQSNNVISMLQQFICVQAKVYSPAKRNFGINDRQ